MTIRAIDVYDVETYPNFFSVYFFDACTGFIEYFEISDWRDDRAALYAYLCKRRAEFEEYWQVGFNNVGFDYPILHLFMETQGSATARMLYEKAQAIIDSRDGWGHTVWPDQRYFTQVDLYLIHHFNNRARSTGLKALEFAMRSANVEDLPIPPGTMLTREPARAIRPYNENDVIETYRFFRESQDMIRFREDLSLKYDRDFLNHNDTKIGKDYFIMRLEEALPGACYTKDGDGRKVTRQTHRPQGVPLRDVIFPYVRFEHPSLQAIKQRLESEVVIDTKGVFSDMIATVDGFTFVFGVGGLHGSIEGDTIVSDGDGTIYDVDVTSYYPSLAIVNRIFPEHLSETFCDIYADLKRDRVKYAKGTVENAMLKLALNGVYGDSNNQYSPFYDMKYMLSITINGQLLLAMLAEQLMKTPGFTLIQANTDGLTFKATDAAMVRTRAVLQWWQQQTALELEEAVYSRMWIRDVNNYIAEYAESGKLKRKGAYEYNRDWHQNHSKLVVPKAVERALVHGADVADTIRSWPDPMDFMVRGKAPSGSHLEADGQQLSKTVRYYVSTTGTSIMKVMPPKGVAGEYKRKSKITDDYYTTVRNEIMAANEGRVVWDERIHTKNRSTYETRRSELIAGKLARVCNDLRGGVQLVDVDYDYYIDEAQKLIDATIRRQ